MGRSIGATLSLNDGNFFTNLKSASSETSKFKNTLTGATDGLKKNGIQSVNAGSAISSYVKKVAGVAVAAVSVSKMVDFGRDCMEAADGQYKAEARLEQLMMNVKGTTLANVDAIKSYAAELQGLTTVGDEVSMVGASQMATFQMQSSSIKTLMPALNDLAVATYGVNVSQDQMQQSANLLGKVMMGQTGALTRVGVTFDKTQEKVLKNGTESEKAAMLVKVLGQNYGGLAAKMAQTPEGRVVQLKNAWGDVKEVIGQELYPIVTNVLGFIAQNIPNVQKVIVGAVNVVKPGFLWLENTAIPLLGRLFISIKTGLTNAFESAKPTLQWLSETVFPVIVDQLKNVVQGISAVSEFIVGNWGYISPIIIGVTAALFAYKLSVVACTAVTKGLEMAQKACKLAQKGFNMVMSANPIMIVAIAIGALVAIGVALYKNWDKLKEKFPKFTGAIEHGINNLKVVFSAVVSYVKVIFEKVGIAVGTAFKNIVVVVKMVINQIQLTFEFFYNIFTGNWAGAWQNIKDAFGNAFNGIKDICKNTYDGLNRLTGGKLEEIRSGIVGKFTSIYNGIKEKMGAVRDTVKSVIENIKEFFNFKWELPKIAMPHLYLESGTLNPMKWLSEGFPKVGVNWYAEGGIMTRPTIFGAAGNTLLAGGEAGAEAVVPLSELWRNMHQTFVERDSKTKSPANITNKNTFNITIDAKDKSAEQIMDELMPIILLKLSNL